MTLIEKNHACQSDVNLALLNLVKQYGSSSYTMLYDQFADLDLDPETAHAKFVRKLDYMVSLDQLQYTGRGKSRRFFLGPMAGQRPLGGKAAHDSYLPTVVDASLARAYPGPLVPPRQLNPMTAPVYVPPPNPALRPGALDYQRYASFGNRC